MPLPQWYALEGRGPGGPSAEPHLRCLCRRLATPNLTLTETGAGDGWRVDNLAGWVSVFLRLKAAVDLGADLRHHDPSRAWVQGFAED